MHRIAFATALFFLATGFTTCDQFQEVPIKSADDGPPTVFNGIWQRDVSDGNGQWRELRLNGGVDIDYTATPGEQMLAVGGGVDGDGLHIARVIAISDFQCCKGHLCSGVQHRQFVDEERQDPPSQVAGTMVSNGIWGYIDVDVPVCPAGSTYGRYGFNWHTEAIDFFGTWGVANGGTIHYQFGAI
ncbi:MAG: hypothetical protein K8W52_12630 [Deltaproteobacteria bacterium]|nr:hypothetical protein [Deltaproteobacteria bacterium]